MSMPWDAAARCLPHLKLGSLLLAIAWSTGCAESGTAPAPSPDEHEPRA